LANSFKTIFMGAAGKDGLPSDDQFNRTSFLSHFDGANNGVNNAFDDGSTNNHTVTANGNVTQGSFGPFARPDGEWGVDFSGTAGDYINYASSADWSPGAGDFTVEFWINPRAWDQAYMPVFVVDYSGSPGSGLFIGMGSGSGTKKFVVNGYADADLLAYATLPALNTWTHILVSRSGTSLKLFYDGVAVATVTSSYNFGQSDLTIGSYGTYSRYLNATISNLHYVKGTATQTSDFTPPTGPSTAVANTKLLACQSNRFVDNSVSPHASTIVGNVAVSAFGPFLTDAVYDPAVNGASVARTNLFLQSNGFDTSPWNATRSSVTAAAGTSPSGLSDAWRWTNTSNNGLLFQPNSYVVGTHTVSAWVKSNGAGKDEFRLWAQSTKTSSDFTATSEWVRYSFTFTITSAGAGNGGLAYALGATDVDVLVYGLQLEAGSIASSYIPTAGYPVTRAGALQTFTGASAYFDGTGDYLSTPSQGTLAASANWCMESYVFFTGTSSGTYRVMSSNLSADPDAYFQMRIRLDKYNFYTDNVDSGLVGTAEYNQWTHMAMTKSGTTVRAFVNGIKLWEATDNGTTVIQNLIIGWGYGSEYFPGYISDARFVNGSSIYTANFTPPTAPLTAITNTSLLLNMADGQAIDRAQQNNLTLYNNAKLSTAQAKFGDTSLLLAGSTGNGSVGGGSIQLEKRGSLSGPFTIETWAWADDTTNAFMWCQGQYKIELGINGNTLRMYKTSSITGDGYINFFTGGEFSVNTWHHVALVRDTSNVIKCYLNGTASGTTLTDATAFPASDGVFSIGSEYHSTSPNRWHGWDGYLDEFRISAFARYTSNFTVQAEQFPDKGE